MKINHELVTRELLKLSHPDHMKMLKAFFASDFAYYCNGDNKSTPRRPATILNLMSENCFMASVDLKDAYYSIPVAKEQRKYLGFIFEGQFYQLTCFPNGLSSCCKIFTKVLKPPLRMKNI